MRPDSGRSPPAAKERMMPNPIILGAKDFAPLLEDAGAMKDAVDALERAMLAEYQGRVRQGSMADETKFGDQPSTARFNFIAADGMPTSLIVATSAAGTNAQFRLLLDGESRQLLA